jgi:hypothetical protein
LKRIGSLLLLGLGIGVAGGASALPITLTLVPSTLTLVAGGTLTVDVVVDGLDNDGEIALESFNLDLAFDASRLAFDALSFGTSLGDPNDGGETFLIGPGNPNVNGVVEMGEFSLLGAAALLALQSAPFVLATVEFTALANPGPLVLEFVNLGSDALGGIGGVPLGDALDPPEAIEVTVPEPAAGALLLVALAPLGRRVRAARG